MMTLCFLELGMGLFLRNLMRIKGQYRVARRKRALSCSKFFRFCSQMYGCRVIQKALESVSDEEQVSHDMVTR
jgi:hypothetical protein